MSGLQSAADERSPAVAESERYLEVRDPADQRVVVGTPIAMDAGEVAAAFEAATAATQDWQSATMLDRAAVMTAAADRIRANLNEGAEQIVRENGKTRAEARVEVTKTADFFEYYASYARLPYGQLLVDSRPGVETSARREPVGVVLAITPWNDPLLTPARKLGPALISGNCVVLKPAPQTPGIAAWLQGHLSSAGLPSGVLQTVTGLDAQLSESLLGNPALRAVTFTGSTAVGALLRRRVADSNVRLQTETGGKNAAVVLADADLDLAAETIAAAAFMQAGQRCTATSRVIVQASVAADLIERLISKARAAVLGHGLEATTTMGPLATKAQQRRVLEHIDRSRSDGGSIITGGSAPDDGPLRYGCFVEPTIISASPGTALWRDEVFGPVIAVVEAGDFDEAVTLANDSAYGLSASIFTRDLGRSHEFIERAEAGQVAVNLPTSGWDVHHPFGGFKDSGSPFKEQGEPGLAFYTRWKTSAVRWRV